MERLYDVEDNVKYADVKAFVFLKLLPVLTWSMFTGVLCGLVISLFHVALSFMARQNSWLVATIAANPAYIPLLLLFSVLLGIAMWRFCARFVEARGSGIPRSEAQSRCLENHKWYAMVSGTFIGTMMSFVGGLSLGMEGPAVQLGAGLGTASADLGKIKGKDRQYPITAGTASGFAVAFGAPIAGLIFAFEDVRHSFKPLLIASCAIAVLGAMTAHEALCEAFGISQSFLNVTASVDVPFKYLYMFVTLGVLCGVFGALTYRIVIRLSRAMKTSSTPYWLPIISVFLVSALVGLIVSDASGNRLALGSGEELIVRLTSSGYSTMSWEFFCVLFFVKLALVMLCFRSNATGGLMVPILTLGALIGGACGHLFVFMGFPSQYFGAVVLVGMSAFFGATISAPLTAFMLVVEVTGFSLIAPSAAIAVGVAFVIVKLFGVKPLYDQLMEEEHTYAYYKDKFLVFRKRTALNR